MRTIPDWFFRYERIDSDESTNSQEKNLDWIGHSPYMTREFLINVEYNYNVYKTILNYSDKRVKRSQKSLDEKF